MGSVHANSDALGSSVLSKWRRFLRYSPCSVSALWDLGDGRISVTLAGFHLLPSRTLTNSPFLSGGSSFAVLSSCSCCFLCLSFSLGKPSSGSYSWSLDILWSLEFGFSNAFPLTFARVTSSPPPKEYSEMKGGLCMGRQLSQALTWLFGLFSPTDHLTGGTLDSTWHDENRSPPKTF